MTAYDVTVPFEPLLVEALGSSSTVRLPAVFDLGAITVSSDADTGIYNATLRVSAPSITSAKQIAVERVREVLHLLATWGDGFGVKLSSQLTATRVQEELPQGFSSAPKPNDVSAAVTPLGQTRVIVDTVEVETHVAVVKGKGSVDFERRALSWREAWPAYLPTVLELNYLATVSAETGTAFLLHYAALEVLEEALLGSVVPLLSKQLERTQRDKLCAEMRTLLETYGLSVEQSARLKNRLLETHGEGKAERIARVLSDLRVPAQFEEIRQVIRQRAQVAHYGKSVENEVVKKAAENARTWVHVALRALLESGFVPRNRS